MTVPGHDYGLHGQRPSDATTATQSESRKESKASEKTAQLPVQVTAQEMPTIEPPNSTPTTTRDLWSARVIITAVLVSLGGMVFGYGGIGTIGGFLLMLDYRKRFGTKVEGEPGQYHLGSSRIGVIVGLLMIGALIGSLGAGKIADKFGRKNSISFWALVFILGSVIEIFAMRQWGQIVAGRTVEGFGIGGLSILVPMYMSEVITKELRGPVIAFYQLFITLGILLAGAVNAGTRNIYGSASWRIPLALGILWPLLLGIGIQFLDESPTWNVRNDKADAAQATLAKLHMSQLRKEEEMAELLATARADKEAGKGTFKGAFTEPTVLRRFIIASTLMMLQQLTGINYFFYFGTELFKTLGVGDGYITAVILGTVNFVATIAGLWVTKRFNHRLALTVGALWIGICLLIYAFFGEFCVRKSGPVSPENAGYVMVVFTCLAIAGFATTWGPLPWVVCAEIWTPRWKGAGMGVATATNWTFNFLIGFFTSKITDEIGYGLGWVFGASILVGAFFVHFFVPETKDKSLEQIDREILEGKPVWR